MNSSSQRKRKCSEASQQHVRDTSNVAKQPAKLTVRRRQKAPADKDTPSVSSREKGSADLTPESGKVEVPELDQSTHSAKIKMLLFPQTESMRLGLEEDGFNPFLELTLSRKKKVSSVVKHLKTKWGSSRFAIGELMIFPFNSLPENTPSLRWTQDNINITAGEVHVAVGSPTVFRLSYGWISGAQLGIAQVPLVSTSFKTSVPPNSNWKECTPYLERQLEQPARLEILKKELRKTIDINKSAHQAVDDQFYPDVTAYDLGNGINVDDVPAKTLVLWDDLTNLSIGGLLSEISLQAKIKHCNTEPETKPRMEIRQDTLEAGLLSDTALQFKNRNQNQFLEKDASLSESKSTHLMSATNAGDVVSKSSEQVNMGKGTFPSEFSWDGNMTNLSIGGLLSEASLHRKINSHLPEVRGSKFCSQETIPLKSFSSAVPGSSSQAPMLLLPECHTSIFDAEETCNAFAFKKSASENDSTSSVVPCIGNSSKAFAFKIFASSRNDATSGELSSVSNVKDCSSTMTSIPPQTIDEKGKTMPVEDQQHKEIPTPLPRRLHDDESSLGLSGIKWNDTLGPFDLGLPKST